MGTNDFQLRALGVGDFGTIIHTHAVLFHREFGWNEDFEIAVAEALLDWRSQAQDRRHAWVAERDGQFAGCIFSQRKDRVAQLRMLMVSPIARGTGLGTHLVRTCMSQAAEDGCREITLWTCDLLKSARRIYQREGWQLIEALPQERFGTPMIGEIWRYQFEHREAE